MTLLSGIREKRKNKIWLSNGYSFYLFIIDGAFSIDTGLELAGVAGPFAGAGSIYNLHKKGGSAGGVSVASPMPKSVSFLQKARISIARGFVIAYLSSVELFGIYHG